MWRKDIAYLFPIQSQTSESDRYWLVELLDHVRRSNREYRYLEIGSYLGGTLTPALLDESCVEVLSIDLRPKLQPDSRNALFDYSHVSTATMLNELKSHGLSDVAKLTTFDGRACDYDFKDKSYQMAFIDAEHTDEAVFRDFMAVYDHLEKGAICAFHDTNLVTAGVENILAFLGYQRRPYWFGMFRESAVAAIFLDLVEELVPRNFLDHVCDWNDFKARSRDLLLMDAFRNRCSVSFALKDCPVLPA